MNTLHDPDVFHILFTRFNVPSGGREKKFRADSDWLENRFDLFDDYCFPSVVSQTMQDFKWLVFFDIETPPEYKDKIQKYSGRYENFIPVYVPEWNAGVINNAVLSVLPNSAAWLLTTRLDNDDALHMDFMKELRSQTFKGNEFFNFKNGFTFSNGVGYRHQHLSNAFLSFVEALDESIEISGVWKWQHVEVIEKFDVNQIYMEYAWLQLIHGGNISNKVRGNAIKPVEWRKYYPSISPGDINQVKGLDLLLDVCIKAPIREFRDLAILGLKKIIKIVFR